MDFEHFFNTPPDVSGDLSLTVSTAVMHVSQTWQDTQNYATFDVTGGTSEDLWTSTAHGLVVGDAVQFRAVGTGAEPYAVDTTYYVIAPADANTFTLSATLGGAALEGTGTDSVGTWILQKRPTIPMRAAELHVTSDNLRVRFGADPAASGPGILIPAGSSLKLAESELTDLRMIRDAAVDSDAFFAFYG
jgi:hypothetical protein